MNFTLRKLIVLVLILTTKLTVFSQQGMDTLPVKCFPRETINLIMKDIVRGEQAVKKLEITEKQLHLTETQLRSKDSIITIFREKETGYISIMKVENEKFSILQDHTKKIEDQLRKERIKNKFVTYISAGAIGILTGLLIAK